MLLPHCLELRQDSKLELHATDKELTQQRGRFTLAVLVVVVFFFCLLFFTTVATGMAVNRVWLRAAWAAWRDAIQTMLRA